MNRTRTVSIIFRYHWKANITKTDLAYLKWFLISIPLTVFAPYFENFEDMILVVRYPLIGFCVWSWLFFFCMGIPLAFRFGEVVVGSLREMWRYRGIIWKDIQLFDKDYV